MKNEPQSRNNSFLYLQAIDPAVLPIAVGSIVNRNLFDQKYIGPVVQWIE